jgi:hypothetical protein
MPRSIITTPYPTMEQTAKLYGLRPKRVAELMRIADKIVAGTYKPAKSRTTKKRAPKTSRSKEK